jgi:hypothetical protein
MGNAICRVMFAATLLVCAAPASTQTELIVVEKPLRAHQVAGVVVDSTGAPIAGVRIDVCDWAFTPLHFESVPDVRHGPCNQDPKHVMGTAITDSNGHFIVPKVRMRGTLYLHLSLGGFDPLEIPIKYSFLANREVRITMHVAT